MSAGGSTCLTETWEAHEAGHAGASRPDYMAGALDVLLLLKGGARPEALLAECVQFGRSIGTPAQGARRQFVTNPAA